MPKRGGETAAGATSPETTVTGTTLSATGRAGSGNPACDSAGLSRAIFSAFLNAW